MIEAEQVQKSGVQVVDVDFVFDGGEAELVRGTVGVAAFGTTTSEPVGEAVVVVIATALLASIRSGRG